MTRITEAPAASPVARWAAVALLVCVGAALHLPFLARPFGPMEVNAGNYFGVFAVNWERHGLLATRGAPLAPRPVDNLATAVPYLNHPPGFAWLSAAFGSDEWQIRAPTAIGGVLASVLLLHVLWPLLGGASALLAALLLLAAPMHVFFSVGSYENAVLPLGLLALLAFDRAARAQGASRRRWRWVLASASVVGPWMDWPYGFMCLAMVPLALTSGLRAGVRRLVLPWVLSAVSIGGYVLWTVWVVRAPGMPPAASLLVSVSSVLSAPDAGGAATPVLAALADGLRQLALGYGVVGDPRDAWPALRAPVLCLAFAGTLVLLRRAPAWWVAMAIAGVLNLCVMTEHTRTHVFFWAYLGPWVAASGAALPLAFSAGIWRRVSVAGVGVIVAWCGVQGVAHLRQSSTPLFAEVGAALTRATQPADAGGRPAAVLLIPPLTYGYYLRSDLCTRQPLVDPRQLEALRTGADRGVGLRYLVLELEGSAVAALPGFAQPPALAEYLDAFARTPVPELIGLAAEVPGYGLSARVRAAYLVTLRE